MGYCVDMTLEDVRILAKNVPAAIRAMLQLMGVGSEDPATAPAFEPEEKDVEADPLKPASYDWVENEQVVTALREGDIFRALSGWRYEAESHPVSDVEKLANLHEHGDVDIESFTGEKWGDDADLWAALAPFIEDGAVITMHGEDDSYWRFVFNDGRLTEQTGRIEWS